MGRPGRGGAAAVAAVVVAVLLGPALGQGRAAAVPAPEPGTSPWAPRPTAAPVVPRPRLVPLGPPPCYAGSTRRVATACVFGPPAARRTVAIVLDSHGWSWWPAIRAAAVRSGVRVAVFAKTACGAVETARAYPFPTGLRGYDECPDWQRSTAREIAVLGPRAVILTSASTAWLPTSGADLTNVRDADVRGARWRAGIAAAVGRYRAITPRVLWLADSPVTTPAALDCASRIDATSARCGVPRALGQAPGRAAEVTATTALRVPLLDPLPGMCDAVWCPSYLNGRPTHRNSGHLAYDWTLTSPVAQRFWRGVLRQAVR